jgi:tricorn protease
MIQARRAVQILKTGMYGPNALSRVASHTSGGCLLLVAVLVGAGGNAWATEGYYRFPDLHGDTLVFTAEGDLWKVRADGGTATRLTSHPGSETHAAISPDGQTVAFSGSYEGPTEVYTMPLAGGLPTRRTWQGRNARVVGWTPAGEVLYATDVFSTLPGPQLVRHDPATGAERIVPLSKASEGTYDPTGRTLFFTRFAFQGSNTKRYQGGTAQSIWRYAEGDPEAVCLTGNFPGVNHSPMYWDGRVYFVSERDGTMNLWSMTPDGGDPQQHTRHRGWDVKTPSLSEGRIAYQLGADLWIYDIRTDQDRKCEIRLVSDFDQERETWVKKPMDYLVAAHPSPNGDRIALTARGAVFVAPAKKGRLVEATHHPGVRYRSAHFLPGGKSLLAISDGSGETEFVRLAANGAGPETTVTKGAAVMRVDGIPSPDGAWIAFQDKNRELWLAETATGSLRLVDRSPEGPFGDLFWDLRWSPDSRWLAYGKPAANQFEQIFLYNLKEGAITPLTTDRYENYSPAWSPDGKWIYFLSDRTLVSVTGGIWGSRQPEPFFDRCTKIYQVPLVPGLRSPFLAPDELHPANAADQTSPDGGAASGSKKEGSGKSAKAAGVKVDIILAGIQERLQEVPLAAGNYSDLAVNDKRLFLLSADLAAEPKQTLQALEIGWEKNDPLDLVKNVKGYELTSDGKKLMVRQEDAIFVLDAACEAGVDLSKSRVDLADWTFAVDPRRERRQMFVEAWRMERDYFYDRKMHGVDWPGVLEKYLPLVDRVTDRAELSSLLADMVSELSALHMFVYGGDLREGPDQIQPASLGAVLSRDEAAGGYRVDRIYRTDPDRPEASSPLLRPGVDVREGDLIEEINGVPVLGVSDPGVALRNQAGKQTLLRVRSAAGGSRGKARDLIVTPLKPSAARDLRYDDWEYSRRRLVEEAGRGEIGYVHLRAMGAGDYAAWSREFYPVCLRQGLVIDVRNNNGGNIDSWILEKLLRRAWMWWQPRVGAPFGSMPYAFTGHLVVLVNESTASDGEVFAEGFRRLGLGKVIGTRTWGGEIWLSADNNLVDNGIATAAETGVYGPEGQWLIEQHGVDPDIVVDNLPAASFRGEDAQLQAAIAHLQGLIREKPVTVPSAPAYPNRSSGPERK